VGTFLTPLYEKTPKPGHVGRSVNLFTVKMFSREKIKWGIKYKDKEKIKIEIDFERKYM
jgi:hypothetical protein